MRKKIIWKTEELWEKYYFGIRSSEFKVNCAVREGTLGYSSGSSLINILKNLYKNNISIHNSDFHIVGKFDFEQSDLVVHADDYGEYFGLKKSQVLEKDGKLVYLFDNHNKILQPFLEYAEVVDESFDVVHVDAHDDDAVFDGACLPAGREKPHEASLKDVQEYVKQTRISDFFDFLSDVSLRGGVCAELDSVKQSRKLIQNIHRYTKSLDFQEFKKPKNPYILSLDIDIFGPEGDFTDLESKIKIIAEAWSGAEMVCIAMSPGFIDQDFAQEIIEIFTKRERDELLR